MLRNTAVTRDLVESISIVIYRLEGQLGRGETRIWSSWCRC